MKRCGVIDVGSNTIRLSIYQYEGKEYSLLMNRKTMAGLADYVTDGSMTDDGVEVACQVLSEYKTLAHNIGIDSLHVFATASLRNIRNREMVVAEIESHTELAIDVITGEDEAALSFWGAVWTMGLDDGLMIDLGGGSTELVWYEDHEIVSACSMSFGSLSLFSNFVGRMLPTRAEARDIKYAVKARLDRLKEKPYKIEEICGVGGTVRAALKLINKYYCKPLDNTTFTEKELRELLKVIKSPDRAVVHMLLKTVPDRIHTIIPGMIALDTIARYYGVKRFSVSCTGVREGYLLCRVLASSQNAEDNDKMWAEG